MSVESILKEHISKNDPIILGVSGGPDSVYLLKECLKYTKNIIVAHINHKLRGAQSDKEALFTEKLAKKHNLTFEVTDLKKQKTGNIEEYCRNKRYEFFEKIRKKHHAKWIMTAHHLNDNIETIIFNLARGSFINGLSGISIADSKRHLLRPLLQITKEEILKHLKSKKIKYKIDPSNKNTKLKRNLIRHKVVPQLKKINTNLEKTFAQNITNLQELDSYLEETVQNWLKKNFQNQQMPHKKFTALHPIIQKTTLLQIYKNLYGNSKKFNQNHLKQILNIIHQSFSNRKKEFGNDYFLQISKSNGRRVIKLTPKRINSLKKAKKQVK